MRNSRIFRRTVPTAGTLCLRSDGEEGADSRVIEGYAITFGTPSEVMGYSGERAVREYIAPEAVTADVLARSDIKLTIEHRGDLLLGRSRAGSGTLSYEIDDHGVRFRCGMPRTAYGDHALEAIRRGDIAGCSFMFTVALDDPEAVTREEMDGEVHYIVRRIERIYDFTLTASPAYPATEVERRSIAEVLEEPPAPDEPPADVPDSAFEAQVAEMGRNATPDYSIH